MKLVSTVSALLLASVVGCAQNPPVTPPPVTPAEPVSGKKAEVPLYEIAVGKAKAKVEAALTLEARRKGLSGRTALPEDQGMLFVYREKDLRRFWMKDCLIPLDLAFLADDGKVLSIHTLPAPKPGTSDDAMPRAESKEAVRYVLELPAGWFKAHETAVGALVTLPKDLPLAKVE